MRQIRWIPFALAFLTVLGLAARPADAQRGGRLRAQIYLVQQRIPARVDERGLLAFARRANARILRETTAEPLPQRKWLADLVIAFNAPPNDLEFHALFYDVTDGQRQFLEDMSTFVNDRAQKTYVQRVRLERPRFRLNRRLEMVVTVRRQEVGTARFDIAGEEERRTGEVSFSESEAR